MFKVGDKVKVISNNHLTARHPTENRYIRMGDILTIEAIEENQSNNDTLFYYTTNRGFTCRYCIENIELVNEEPPKQKLCSCSREQVIYRECNCGGL